ncbi:glycosyltransferase family 4 protein [Bradyrhizobium jicamae]|uniref:glycosyltransferase family 4 protein n=1 Tax=Bradyrhizobium jicamae TaxID=280332 RepID=UPI001BA9543F|nr:glycosyltransferase family 4 protein [Bradyrhizobium jicamae]MBR0937878.1 glycosyltransferase family 4 protein [Bradyrhizobium jicamae]
MADAWTKMGHRVVVVSAAFHHLHMEPRTPGAQRIGRVDFWFLDTPRYGNESLGRLRNNLYFGPRLRLNANGIANLFGKPDLVIASSPHLFFVRAAEKVARRFNAKFWVEVRDLWPKSIVALGMTPAWHPLVKVLAWEERRAYRSADHVVCLLANAEVHMRSRGLAANKFTWIPNGVSDEEIQRALEITAVTHSQLTRITRAKAQGRRVVFYAGGMGPPNAMEVIVDAARVAAKTNPDISFVLIGSGGSRESLEQRAADLPNVEFLDEVDRSVVHAMLHASDCAVVSFHKNSLYDYGISPNKLFDYCLFAPRTVIACEATALSGLGELVTTRCEPDDAAGLARALASALAAPGRPPAERIAVARRYSYSELAARYLA